jgi:hypothetical protein
MNIRKPTPRTMLRCADCGAPKLQLMGVTVYIPSADATTTVVEVCALHGETETSTAPAYEVFNPGGNRAGLRAEMWCGNCGSTSLMGIGHHAGYSERTMILTEHEAA